MSSIFFLCLRHFGGGNPAGSWADMCHGISAGPYLNLQQHLHSSRVALSLLIVFGFLVVASAKSSDVIHQIPDMLIGFDFSKRGHAAEPNSILHYPEQFSIGVA